MSSNTEQHVPPRMLYFIPVVMFLFGGTVGYIARDVRADTQLMYAITGAGQRVQHVAEAVQRSPRLSVPTTTVSGTATPDSEVVVADEPTTPAPAAAQRPPATSGADAAKQPKGS
jgi:hypothetical protein